MAMIEIKNVTKSYGPLQVLKGISADVQKGEVVCLIGPSGSGKSTMLRCLNGLETYQGGDILIEGQRVNAKDRSIHDIRTRMAMVFQRFNLFPHRTALENVIEGPVYVKGEKPAEARKYGEHLLQRVGLGDRANHYPGQLSGGQMQRVAIARALAMRPQAILFDEPTSALDPELVGDVLDVMRSLADEGLTMLVVTHEMGFAREVSNQVIFLHQGLIEEQGDPREVMANPRSERLARFLSGNLK